VGDSGSASVYYRSPEEGTTVKKRGEKNDTLWSKRKKTQRKKARKEGRSFASIGGPIRRNV